MKRLHKSDELAESAIETALVAIMQAAPAANKDARITIPTLAASCTALQSAASSAATDGLYGPPGKTWTRTESLKLLTQAILRMGRKGYQAA